MREPLGDSHCPVLVDEVLENLRLTTDNGVFVDATVGLGGHAEAVLERFPSASVVGIDIDSEALELCKRRLERYGERFMAIRGSYGDMGDVLSGAGIGTVDSILIDTGLSSYDIGTAERGFSFMLDGPLDMRYSRSSQVASARALINRQNARELRKILRDFGEVPFAGRVAAAIVEARKKRGIRTTGELAAVVRRSIGHRLGHRRIESFLAKVFQAFRIAVNRELEVLDAGLRQSIASLAKGGRLLVICYESLSHRLTKQVFREHEGGRISPEDVAVSGDGQSVEIRIVNRRAIRASASEVARNIRSRSAGLRIAERL
ncbi:MAG: 16S rRNA (cytosine(1402)-N(4))-methyltransferase [Candidatus Coatesbacteria bacterium]|nr:MAG: 16S rRNA (cytosine(1402)-N(4))-methyltransferase [Candidatus Coatesbacteria bacterium]